VHRDGQEEICSLGNRAPTIPSVIFLKSDDTILTGDPANRRALSEPERVAREFKRRMGDPTPIMLGGTPYPAEVLTAKLLEWVLDQVSTREGGAPDGRASRSRSLRTSSKPAGMKWRIRSYTDVHVRNPCWPTLGGHRGCT